MRERDSECEGAFRRSLQALLSATNVCPEVLEVVSPFLFPGAM